MAKIRRISDGIGDTGQRVEAIKWNEDGSFKEIVSNRPVVGCSLLVGSVTARTYSENDYWLTTEITNIIEETENEDGLYVKFKTENSTYDFWS
jgi:hypothetical protein